MVKYLLLFLTSFCASIIQNVIGFGYVIFAMSLWPLLLPLGDCVAVSQLSGMVLSGVAVLPGRRSIPWKTVCYPALFSSLSCIISLLFVRNAANATLMRALGLVLVLLALWMLRFSDRLRIVPSPSKGLLCGLIAGVMGALFGVPAPALVLYYSSASENKEEYMLSLQFTLCLSSIVNIITRYLLGMWSAEVLLNCIPALLGVFLGRVPGKWLYSRMNLKTFKTVVYCFLAVLGVYIFFSNL